MTLFLFCYYRTLKDYYLICCIDGSKKYLEKTNLNCFKDAIIHIFSPLFVEVLWQKIYRIGIYIIYNYRYSHNSLYHFKQEKLTALRA